ncbi:MAG: alpha/beta hydrolase [Bacillota bacterium]|nr:alpha/beta hydrolase [Bacillota bacterium]
MKKIFMILLVALLALASCSSDKEEADKSYTDDELLEIGEEYINALLADDFEGAYEDFNHDEDMEKAVNPEGYREIFTQLYQQTGDFKEMTGKEIAVKGDYRLASYGLVFENQSLNANVVFNDDGSIGGLNFAPYTFESPEKLKKNEIEVTFGVEKYKLDGIITLPPSSSGPYPCVILVHGSGPSDMDESIGPNKPFKDIAEMLSNKGIAVFRYDKRTFTYGREMVEAGAITPYEETVEDVVKAYDFLLNRSEIDSDNIYILGHSMGGHLVPKINEHLDNPAGFIIMAGNISPLEDLMVEQIQYLSELDGSISEEERQYIEEIEIEVEKIKNLDEVEDGEMVLNANKEYWQYYRDYNVMALAKEIDVPTLVLQGERDYQVDMEEFNMWKETVGDLDNFKFISYPKLNHLMMPGEGTPNSEEYMVKNKVSENVINDIYNFIMEEY